MASLTGQLVAETYKALLKTIDNDILTASEKQITDGFGGGSNVFIDSQGFLRANKYKVTDGLATQFLKADGSLDYNAYAIDSNTVHLTGNEIIYGFKTFATGANIQQLQIKEGAGFSQVSGYSQIAASGSYFHFNNGANTAYARFLYGTGQRTYTLPSIDGTIALISDIPTSTATWGAITGTLSNQTDLQNALNAKYNNPSGTISQYIRGDGSIATFPTVTGLLPTGGTAGQILAKIDATDYNTQWIDNYATQTKNEVKLGAALTKGTPVYVSSANGTNMIVSAASNTSEATSSKTFGLLETGGVLNDQVKCVTFGLLAGLDTSTAQAGDAVWLGPNGTLLYGLANKPVAPAHMVYIGVVTRVQSNNGEIFVNVQNGFEIEELHDVLIQSKVNNQGLFYESSTGLWKNKSIATVLGYTPANDAAVVHNIGDETVNGRKTFTTQQTFNNSFLIKNTGSGSVPYGGWTTIWTSDSSFNISVGTSASTSKLVTFLYGSTNPQLTLPSADGTLALVSQLSNFVSGSGSTGYIPKWTSSSVIGSSLLYDNGTSLGYGTDLPNFGNYGRTFTGAGFGTASFGFEALSNSITNNALLGGLSFVIGTNDSSRRIGSAIQAYLLASTATNYGAELRFYAKADAGVLGEVARMTSTGLRVYGTIVKDGGTSAQFLKADGSIDSNTYLTTGSASSTYLPLTGGTLTGQLIISASGMGAQINGGTFTQGTASSYALGVANGGGYDLTLGTSSTAGIIQTWSSKPLSLNPQGNNVLIGTTTNDGNKFQVAGNASFTNSYSNTSDLQIIASSNIAGINLRSTQGGRFSIMQSYIAANVTSFMTSTGTNNPSIEAIRIANSSGDITFISSIMAIYGGFSQLGSSTTITQNARFTNTATSTANGSGVGFDFALYDSTGAGKQTGQIASIWSDNSSNNVADLAFYTRPTGAGITEKMRISGNGAVSIGNKQGNSQFTVSEYNTGNPQREFNVNTGVSGIVRLFAYNRNTGAIPLVLQDPGGTVLIGQQSAYDALTRLSVYYASDLDVTSGAGDASLRLRGSYGQIRNEVGALYISCAGATGDMYFRTGSSTERMRIASGGNILIGTGLSDSGQKLQVNGTAKIEGAVYRYNGQTLVSGSVTNLTSIDLSSSRTYLLQMIPTNIEANLSYRWFGVLQYNSTSGTFAAIALASQTVDITISGSTIQARVTNGQQWTFNWTITQLL
jgi:hypothetical protein